MTFVVVVMLCALASAGPGTAGAAVYSVYSCSGPTAEPLPNSAWTTAVITPGQALDFSFGANCGDLSVSASPTASFAAGDGADQVFDAPPGTTISGYQLTRAVDVSYPAVGSTPPTLSAGVRETTDAVTGVFGCSQVIADCMIAPAVVTRNGLALTSLSVGIRCDGLLGDCQPGGFTKLSAQLQNARVDVEDPAAPVIASVGGSLPGSDAAAGTHTLDVTATDVGGGVRTINLAVDGALQQSSAAGGSCGQPYIMRAPCPSGLVRTLSVNTATLTAGVHTGTLTAIDAAGTSSAPYSFSFSVSAGAPGAGTIPSNGSPAVQQPIVRTSRSVIASKNGRSVLVEGTLTTQQGAPIAGAVLEVSSLDLGVFNAVPKSIGTTTTTPTGGFSLSIKPHGVSRISVLFRPDPASIGTAISATVVREALSLSINRSKSRVKPGGSLTLAGALDGAGAAADGAPIEIDALIGGSWRAVGVVEANSRGSYRWRYRFTRVKRATRFTFRAIVRRNKSWPWPTEKSRSLHVLVAR
ncbi:MAG: hypothetical protein JHD02_09005 [Thermoleophilaceae bacterium]|nr:hypothetical protein [Thermoleophilaceae bacterium]